MAMIYEPLIQIRLPHDDGDARGPGVTQDMRLLDGAVVSLSGYESVDMFLRWQSTEWTEQEYLSFGGYDWAKSWALHLPFPLPIHQSMLFQLIGDGLLYSQPTSTWFLLVDGVPRQRCEADDTDVPSQVLRWCRQDDTTW